MRNFGPNWYASVMGTGIVATSAATLPYAAPALRPFAVAAWLLAAGALLAVTAAFLTSRHHHRTAHPTAPGPGGAPDHATAQFYGAPPMALLTVGAGALLLGRDLLGPHLALAVDAVLWTLGTLLGLASAVAVPYRMMSRPGHAPEAASPTWLLPVVAPMVSASTGALLVPHLPAGQPRLDLLLACYALFGVSLLATLAILPQVWGRLVRQPLALAAVPTVWIVLGPLGQSVTAANLLGDAAHTATDGTTSRALELFGLVYGVPVLGFALVWIAIAGLLTARAARAGLPFTMTWWSFTFPVGTCVTAATGLAHRTGSQAFAGLAVGLFVALVTAWAVVATRTLRSLVTGGRLAPAPTPASRTVDLPGQAGPATEDAIVDDRLAVARR
ncbi:TDT family transporter [Longispora sp. K20-0274]|uniref:TDT family transporter n=1 Tax=Longispora sp. K20-0274 TaxID=3088255 RepID=UPI00399AF28F